MGECEKDEGRAESEAVVVRVWVEKMSPPIVLPEIDFQSVEIYWIRRSQKQAGYARFEKQETALVQGFECWLRPPSPSISGRNALFQPEELADRPHGVGTEDQVSGNR